MSHQYLRKLLNLDPLLYVNMEFKQWLKAGCVKFHEQRRWLGNKYFPKSYRIKFSNMNLTPVILYASAILHIGDHEKDQFDIMQWEMMKLIFGWIRHAVEDCEIMMRCMIDRVQYALHISQIINWIESFRPNRWRFVTHAIKSMKNPWIFLRV